MKNRYFRHPADSNPLIIQAQNLRKLYFSRCPSKNRQIDLAFELPNFDNRSRFKLEIREEVPSLCGVDIVVLDEISDALKAEILTEGKLLYES